MLKFAYHVRTFNATTFINVSYERSCHNGHFEYKLSTTCIPIENHMRKSVINMKQ